MAKKASKCQNLTKKTYQHCPTHDYKSKSCILEKPGICEKLWKRNEQMKSDLFQRFLYIPDFILNSIILPFRTPTTCP